MAYQNIGSTCRFYINTIEWLGASGLISMDNRFKTLPVAPTSIDVISVPSESKSYLTSDMDKFVFILGHNMASNGNSIMLNDGDGSAPIIDNVVNIGDPMEFDGFSLFKYTGDLVKILVNWSDIGSIIIGNTYTMPSANLNLTMSREYGGTKEITSHNGSSFSNTMWNRQPLWGDMGAWELFDPIGGEGTEAYCSVVDADGNEIDNFLTESMFSEMNLTVSMDEFCSETWWTFQAGGVSGTIIAGTSGAVPELTKKQLLARSGRRVWQLTFSYMDDAKLWGPNQSLAESAWGIITEEQGWDAGDIDYTHHTLNKNLLIDDSFFSMVWHRTLNGTLSFVFQPDTNDVTSFAIARFRNNSLKATLTAPGVYDMSVIIEEVF